ncbi:hypothetical protein [Deinococcus radiotolerans]|uniref:DUF3611 family protein n=1 Tax=Deinococcus radiotolerans TaxID=1309407 RepID=A0ABQ2FKN6_9DEIO|nr:hypothetical protein [Deinococcus radiotolerans]GGL07237.1 hypothetical protein GCM10010844_27550 [Deinococcus radiotolerans]
MTPRGPAGPPDRWRTAALAALWALAAATLGLGAYSLWRAGLTDQFAWLATLRALLAAVVLVWWTQLLARYTRAAPTPEEDGVRRSLRALFPWLTSLRLALWALSALAYLSGQLNANPVALAAIASIELGFILAKNAGYGSLVRAAPHPEDPHARARLLSWLNVTAPLSLALGVVNVVPVAGLSGAPDAVSLTVYGLHALLDVTATLLALKAVQTAPGAP